MPPPALGSAAVPATSVPTEFPSTTSPVGGAGYPIVMPQPALPLMTLPAPAAVPPIVLFDVSTSMPPAPLGNAPGGLASLGSAAGPPPPLGSAPVSPMSGPMKS